MTQFNITDIFIVLYDLESEEEIAFIISVLALYACGVSVIVYILYTKSLKSYN